MVALPHWTSPAIARAALMEVVRTTSYLASLPERQKAYKRAVERLYDVIGLPYDSERVSRLSFHEVEQEMEECRICSFDHFCRLVAACGKEEDY